MQKKKVVWDTVVNKPEPKKLVLYLRNGARCPCEQLENTKNHYLIMGRNVDNHLILTGIHRWDEKNEEFKKLLTQIKTYKCPTLLYPFK